jgi:Methyltransferase domain
MRFASAVTCIALKPQAARLLERLRERRGTRGRRAPGARSPAQGRSKLRESDEVRSAYASNIRCRAPSGSSESEGRMAGIRPKQAFPLGPSKGRNAQAAVDPKAPSPALSSSADVRQFTAHSAIYLGSGLRVDTDAGRDASYVLGQSAEEVERLQSQAAFLQPFTERLFRDAGIARGMKVSDLGSGAGDVAMLAARLVGPEGVVVGIDTNPAILEIARA